ncbi:tRNA (guanine(37)-N(1))-methyltransferase [Malassezia sp. CBS 17886]|nr:tRNA (guanine(37)-N(1))-methyltransferase [Malassezia sp. CBS 17886]
MVSSCIDKPRFHRTVHPARAKTTVVDAALEPSADVARLALRTSRTAPADAPPLQSHAQAGIEMQERAEHDMHERAQQQAEQMRWLECAKRDLRKTLPLLGVRVRATQCGDLAKHPAVHTHVFRSKRTKHICADPSGDEGMRVLQLGATDADALPPDAHAAIDAAGGAVIAHPVVLDWDYWTVDQVLRALLPAALEEGAPSAFSMVGHIAHVNLREEYLAFRFLIGQLILEKTPRVRTVVNKLDSIDTEFRVFAMELLAGEPVYEAEVSESGCLFQLDFRAVYWNSRLHTEHARLIAQFAPLQVVADVMAGIGPFAVPAAKKGCWVLANDLNPSCFASLETNSVRNHVSQRLVASCMDGRAFVSHSVRACWAAAFPGAPAGGELLSARQRRRVRRDARAEESDAADADVAAAGEERGGAQNAVAPAGSPTRARGTAAPAAPTRPRRLVDHFVMNLPATALEFLDAFRGVYTALAAAAGRDALEAELAARASSAGLEPMPMVHVHCFTKDLEHPGEDICRRASQALGLAGSEKLVPPAADGSGGTRDLSLHLVRSVAPSKDMYCLSFRLPYAVAFAADV